MAGKVDYLRGLKENVIVGLLIPAGTGLKAYRSINIETEHPEIVSEEVKEQVKEVEGQVAS